MNGQMLFAYLFVLSAAFHSDTVNVSLVIRAPRSDAPEVGWIVLDSASTMIDRGRTPTELSRRLYGATETVCADDPVAQISVNLNVEHLKLHMNGVGHCFRYGVVGKRMRLDGVVDPRQR